MQLWVIVTGASQGPMAVTETQGILSQILVRVKRDAFIFFFFFFWRIRCIKAKTELQLQNIKKFLMEAVN